MPKQQTVHHDDLELVGERDRKRMSSLSRVQAWRLEKLGLFPRRIQISPGRVGWLKSEIEAWIKERADRRESAR